MQKTSILLFILSAIYGCNFISTKNGLQDDPTILAFIGEENKIKVWNSENGEINIIANLPDDLHINRLEFLDEKPSFIRFIKVLPILRLT